MKKAALLIVCMGFVLNTVVNRPAAAATTSITWPIGISIAAGAIDLSAIVESMHFGYVEPGSTVFSNQPQGLPRCTIENRGYATIDYTASATITSSGNFWVMGSFLGDVGMDKCVVAAIFTQPLDTASDSFGTYSRDLIAGDFANNDVLGPIALVATTDTLARDNSAPDPDDAEHLKGYNILSIPHQSVRSLRFMVQTPTMVTTGSEQFINITIGAIVQ